MWTFRDDGADKARVEDFYAELSFILCMIKRHDSPSKIFARDVSKGLPDDFQQELCCVFFCHLDRISAGAGVDQCACNDPLNVRGVDP